MPGTPDLSAARPMDAAHLSGSVLGDLSREDASRRRCIAVRLAGELFGLAMEDVQEVIDLRSLARVFHASHCLAGVTNLRGEVLPVIELGAVLGMAHAPAARGSRVVVVRERGGRRRRAGLVVDSLDAIRTLPEEELAPLPPTASANVRRLAEGLMLERPACTLLDVSRTLDAAELAGPSSGGSA
jgi:purine-binding chemotaxis protein CheW